MNKLATEAYFEAYNEVQAAAKDRERAVKRLYDAERACHEAWTKVLQLKLSHGSYTVGRDHSILITGSHDAPTPFRNMREVEMHDCGKCRTARYSNCVCDVQKLR